MYAPQEAPCQPPSRRRRCRRRRFCCRHHFPAKTKTAGMNTTAFVLNHSKEYTGALLACWAEFLVEALLLPELKQQPGVVIAGAVLVLVGHWFRVGAMWTAGSNFNHEIMQRVRRERERQSERDKERDKERTCTDLG